MTKTLAKLMSIVAVAGAVLVAWSTPSFAYFSVKGGLFMPNDKEDGLKEFDNGFNVEVAYGMQSGSAAVPIAVEFGVGYYKSSASDSEDGIDVDADMTVIPITATAKALLPVSGGISLYAGFGVGFYLADFEASATDGFDTFSISDDDKPFGFQVVGGVEFPIGSVSGLLEIKWFAPDANFTFEGEDTGDLNIGGVVLNAGIKF